MLGQVHRLTGAGAQGIAEEFPTAQKLFEAYEGALDARTRDGLVAGCKVRSSLRTAGFVAFPSVSFLDEAPFRSFLFVAAD